jgi:hypothetical protein
VYALVSTPPKCEEVGSENYESVLKGKEIEGEKTDLYSFDKPKKDKKTNQFTIGSYRSVQYRQ